MASTISNNTLTILIHESIELGGIERGSKQILSISNVNEIDNRIITALSSSEQSLFKLSNAASAGTFITSSMKYARITNKDDTNFVILNISYPSTTQSLEQLLLKQSKENPSSNPNSTIRLGFFN